MLVFEFLLEVVTSKARRIKFIFQVENTEEKVVPTTKHDQTNYKV